MKGFLISVGVVALLAVLWLVSWGAWFADRATAVVQQQIDPQELLRKYEWFKDAAAALDAKQASIRVYDQKVSRFTNMHDLDRTNREQLMIWEQEAVGLKLSYNDLAKEYNAQMAKINWRFCNRGDLPAGASTPLPREYKPYIEQ